MSVSTTITLHLHVITPNAVGYSLLIVGSHDPNLDIAALSQLSARFHFVDLYINIKCRDHYQRLLTLVLELCMYVCCFLINAQTKGITVEDSDVCGIGVSEQRARECCIHIITL